MRCSTADRCPPSRVSELVASTSPAQSATQRTCPPAAAPPVGQPSGPEAGPRPAVPTSGVLSEQRGSAGELGLPTSTHCSASTSNWLCATDSRCCSVNNRSVTDRATASRRAAPTVLPSGHRIPTYRGWLPTTIRIQVGSKLGSFSPTATTPTRWNDCRSRTAPDGGVTPKMLAGTTPSGPLYPSCVWHSRFRMTSAGYPTIASVLRICIAPRPPPRWNVSSSSYSGPDG